jgi:hypothetical protein
MVVHVLSDQRGAPSSENLSNVARKQSKEKEQAGHRHAVYNLLAITAAFKEKSRIFNSAEDAPYYSKEDFKYGEMNWQINDGNATMSIHDQPPKCGIIVFSLKIALELEGESTDDFRNGNTTRMSSEKIAQYWKITSSDLQNFFALTENQENSLFCHALESSRTELDLAMASFFSLQAILET